MSSKDMSRRKFIENVAKYCGAGVAFLGMMGPGRVHGGTELEVPAHEGMWRMRDGAALQSADWRKNAFVPPGIF
jgi:hypothetical protein